ncbi:MAG: hypothetical protein AAGE93_16330 [Bacteroidota bacterium]
MVKRDAMYLSRSLKLLVGLLLLLTSCENSDDSILTQKGVTTRVEGETIVIDNNHGKPISYFAVENETAQVINWAAISSDENTIANRASKTISWDDIISDGSLQSGDYVIVYWWVAQDSISTSAELKQNIVVL